MIEPTEADIGRGVIYLGNAGERERGVISSFNQSFVFVRYHQGATAAATKREQLEWEFAAGQRVRMLIETCGEDHEGVERSYPIGASGQIVGVNTYPLPQGLAYSVCVEDEIVNVFDESDGPGPFFEAAP